MFKLTHFPIIQKPDLRVKGALAAIVAAFLVFFTITPAQADDDTLTPVSSYTATSGDYGIRLDRHSNGGLQVSAWNNSTSEQTFGIGANLSSETEITNLWQLGIKDYDNQFSTTVAPGDVYTQNIPDWPGKTYVFYNDIDAAQPTELGRYIIAGRWIPLEFIGDETNGLQTIRYGYPVSFGDNTVQAGGTIDLNTYGINSSSDLNVFAVPEEKVINAFNPDNYVVSPNAAAGLLTFNRSDAYPIAGQIRAVGGSASGDITIPQSMPPGNYAVFVGDGSQNYFPGGPFDLNKQYNLTVTAPGATAVGTGVDIKPAGQDEATAAEFTFDNVTAPGITTVNTSSTGPAPTGFSTLGATPVYYNLETTATFAGTVTVCISFDTSTVDPANASTQHLYHYTNGAWVDITSSSNYGSVCGITSSFSPFAVGTPAPVAQTKFKFKAPVKSAGSTTAVGGLPYLLSFSGAKGLALAKDYPVSQQVNCKTGAKIGAPVKAKAILGGLLYLPKINTYTYIWQTDRSWRNTCRVFTMQLKNGSAGEALFALK
jgi:hypothetical protein